MRNKEKFIENAYAVLKPEFKEEVNVVEDAALVMNHTASHRYVLSSDFTTTGKDETFLFDLKDRPKTDNESEAIKDYFYVGKEGA